MAQSGRSWNDPKRARDRAAGAQSPATAPSTGGSPARPAGGKPADGGGGGRPGWRAKAAAATAQRGKRRHWLVSQSENPNRLRHRAKLAIAVAALLVLIGFFLFKALWAPRNTPLLLVGVLDYAAPFPPNAWVEDDFHRFRSVFLAEGGTGTLENVKVFSELGERQWKDGDVALLALKRRLADLKPGGPDKKTVLIYISGHGILDAEGEPCLVLATDRGDTENWHPEYDSPAELPLLRVQKILDLVAENYADQGDVKKVLLLDCHRIQTNVQLGILENRFGEALRGLRFADENLFVLTSAGPGQVAWPLGDRGASAFGYYVCQGLVGRANQTENEGNGDKLITLDELARYVRKQVSQQVQSRYLAAQLPALLPEKSEGRAAETELAWSNQEPPAESPPSSDSPAVKWEEIDGLWTLHYELKQRHGIDLSESTQQWRARYGLTGDRPSMYRGPDLVSFEAFQQGLLRLEQLNDAGRHYKNEAQRLAARLKILADDLERAADEAELPVALALRQVGVPGTVQQQVDASIRRDLKEEELAALAKLTYEERAKAVWNYWLAWSNEPPTIQATIPNEYRRTLNVLGGGGGTAGSAGSTAASASLDCDPVEIRFLRLLDPRGFAPAELFAGEGAALRSAIASRDLAEAAAWANDDVRAHYAVMPLVEEGDALRRQKEDQLFVQPQSLAAGGRPWPDAEAKYKEALDLAVDLSLAMDTRDQTWQELPYLAEWLVLRRETDSQRSAVDAQLATSRTLISENRRLATAIDGVLQKCLQAGGGDPSAVARFPVELAEARKELDAAASAVRDHLDELLAIHRRAISDVRDAGTSDVANLRRIRDLLSTPLVTGVPLATGHERGQLRRTLLSSRRNVQALVARSTARPAGSAAAAAMPLKDHPVLALFPDDAAALVADPDRLAGKLREALHRQFSTFRAVATDALATTADSKGLIERSARMKLSAAEQEVRAHAALWTLNPVYGEAEKRLHDPPLLALIDGFDRHHAILWQASRALDDFWGKEGDPRGQEYFAAIGKLALQQARAVGPGERGSEYQTIFKTLSDLEQAAKNWAQVNVPSIKLPAAADPSRTVETQPAITAERIPTGQATFIARQSDNRPANIRQGGTGAWQSRLAAPLDKPLGAVTLELPPSTDDAALRPWPVALFYRGHVYRTELTFTRKTPGQRFELARHDPPPPIIMVRGEKRDPGSVTFIFDCSGSMGKPLPEQNDIVPMLIARPALREVLGELASDGRYEASLWFYGHRVNWDVTNNRAFTVCDYLRRSSSREALARIAKIAPDWCAGEPPRLSEDAQLVWPASLLGDPPHRQPDRPTTLTPQRLGELTELVNTVRPFGVTPLYYSMAQAIENDPNLQTAGNPRRLIVLTDGKNNVDDSRSRQTPTEAWRARGYNDVKSVVRAMESKGVGAGGIDLHVIGFGEEVQQARTKKMAAPQTPWPDETSKVGSYHAVADIRRLKEVIRNAVGLKNYRVTSGDRLIDTKPLNQEIFLNEHRRRAQYEVALVGSQNAHKLTLEGGEAIDLRVADGQSSNPHLIHTRYTKEEQENSLASVRGADNTPRDPNGPQRFYIGFQRTRREPGIVEFPISIQNYEDTKFSPRPAEAWVEITPIIPGASNAPLPLLFYDLQFADSRPVPMLLCRTSDWPAEAQRARIDLFFKMRPTETARRRPVREVRSNTPSADLELPAPSGGKIRFTVQVSQDAEHDGARITVTEQCPQQSDLHHAKVQVETPPDIIVRQYLLSTDGQEVKHEFIYEGKRTGEVLDYWVNVTSRDELERGAFHLHEPVEVKVVP